MDDNRILIKTLLADNIKKYPLLTVTDAVKLLFQSYCGAGHLVADEARAIAFLEEEHNACACKLLKAPLPEPLLNGFCRYPIDCLDKSALKALALTFCADSREKADKEGLCYALGVLKSSLSELFGEENRERGEEIIDEYIAKGCPVLSHSAAYRAAYNPHYRVLKTDSAKLIPLLSAVFSREERPTVIALDGRCGSGKSYYADKLSKLLNAPIIRADDFFLPKAMRTAERLAEPGGNFHYERFAAEVVAPLTAKNEVNYRPYSCSQDSFGEPRRAAAKPYLIVEGAYCLSPRFGRYYDVSAACNVTPELQQQRLLAREGKAALAVFNSKWIRFEESYIAETKLFSRCDFVID